MGLLSRLRRRPASHTAEVIALHAGDIVEVVGESYRQDVLRRLAARTTNSSPSLDELSGYARKRAESDHELRWFRAALIREPNNPKDKNAVAVHADGLGLVGYLDRDAAIEYRPVFQALEARGYKVAGCPAFLIGGEIDKPSFGVLLCLSSPERIVRDLEETMST